PPGRPPTLRTPEAVWRGLPGPVSGIPECYRLSEVCTAECYRRMDRKRHVLIAAGGVTPPQAAYAQIPRGASLVPFVTRMVYEGPLLARRVARGLARLLERDGFDNVAAAVGADLR